MTDPIYFDTYSQTALVQDRRGNPQGGPSALGSSAAQPATDLIFIGGEGNGRQLPYYPPTFLCYRTHYGRKLLPQTDYFTYEYTSYVAFAWAGPNAATGNLLIYSGIPTTSGPNQGPSGGTVTMFSGINLTPGYTQLSVVSSATHQFPGRPRTVDGKVFAFYLVESGSGRQARVVQAEQLMTQGSIVFSISQLGQGVGEHVWD